MVYADEDEVDWSDGSLNPPSPGFMEPVAGPSRRSPVPEACDDSDSLSLSDTYEQYSVPCGLPLDSTFPRDDNTQLHPTRLQRARTGVRLNRRMPSKEDYSNFALYQANQKAYEATFLKTFVAHALHPDQIAQCSEDMTDEQPTVEHYLKSVSREVNRIANKMVWNAHCRIVHLLANDGKDGAPFLDVHAFNSEVFSNFGPGNLSFVTRKMDESWHRVNPNPSMVRFSTTDYPTNRHAAPLEEIDDVTGTLFRKNVFGKTLPIGRPTKLPTSRKQRGQNMPGAAIREERHVAPRGNWLTFTSPAILTERLSPLPTIFTPHEAVDDAEMPDASQALQSLAGSHILQLGGKRIHSPADRSTLYPNISRVPPTQVEELFGRYGVNSLNSEHIYRPTQTFRIDIEKVHSWRMRLINGHKRRLMQKWGNPPQTLDRALQGIRQAVAAAIAMGYRPTEDDYQEQVQAITAREQQQDTHPHRSRDEEEVPSIRDKKGKGRAVEETRDSQEQSTESPNKKRKVGPTAAKSAATKPSTKQKTMVPKSAKQIVSHPHPTKAVNHKPLPPHPSGSKTLELHQNLPPDAYFESASIDEKPAWRCGIKHAMGHYYNAGDRKSCRGCNTSICESSKVNWMDFYMLSRSFHYQPAPGTNWRPCKPTGKTRKSDRPCHNSIAKDAYWSAVNAGATEGDAHQMGISAVREFLKPKPPPKEPTPEPTPEPEPDHGPHLSGSTTMEHDQELPDGAYWEKQEHHVEYAWRCDVNHALGRYYLAGDKKTCPGCGSSRTGQGKRETMDFYLPQSLVVRQEAPGLSKWKPRKPNKSAKPNLSNKSAVTHNQMCSRAYFKIVDEGHGVEEALRLAVEQIDAELDEKQEEVMRKQGVQDDDDAESVGEVGETSTQATHLKNDSTNTSHATRSNTGHAATPTNNAYRRNSRGGGTFRMIPEKMNINDLSDDEMDEVEVYESDREQTQGAPSPREVIEISSAEEESSGSDSE
ncbi:hypothetical protein EJ02DRAFT_391519 [Clathrospora elynae]|uniref:Uncharacterized protein n=1 Tax=Clathrospora elynae TaxID=706981 RepID=A0A6A5T878_9PLEO|nr:hypothetical protein EJ02DRAFT_391519 [Clathrospora elynae]